MEMLSYTITIRIIFIINWKDSFNIIKISTTVDNDVKQIFSKDRMLFYFSCVNENNFNFNRNTIYLAAFLMRCTHYVKERVIMIKTEKYLGYLVLDIFLPLRFILFRCIFVLTHKIHLNIIYYAVHRKEKIVANSVYVSFWYVWRNTKIYFVLFSSIDDATFHFHPSDTIHHLLFPFFFFFAD